MFPIYNNMKANFHHASATSSIASYVTGSSELLVPGRITAATSIPQGTVSGVLEAGSLLGHPDIQQLSVSANPSSKLLDLEDNSKKIWCKETHWVRALRLSDDCHSYNIQLKIQKSIHLLNNNNKLPKSEPLLPKLILETVRPIEAGQELLLWFSEDILAMLQIVFLTPANIQGQKKYVCTRCSALYESPNPLKLHITLSCSRFPTATLWEKLSKILAEETSKSDHTFEFKLSEPNTDISKQKCAMDLSKASETLLYRPYERSSAFKPFKKIEEPLKEIPPMWPVALPNNIPMRDSNDEAQLECLVSSLGKSKQGHICLYCGKCYSRKYGLKIHIRTHTGYKPLKCKFCLRPFGDPSNLNKHVRLHAEGNTPYKCDLCGKILVRRRDLERHLKSRHLIEMNPSVDILTQSNSGNEEISDEDGSTSSLPVKISDI